MQSAIFKNCNHRGLSRIKVMQFGFDGNLENPHLPCTRANHAVPHTVTHDNNKTRGWSEALPDRKEQLLQNQVGWSTEDSNGTAALVHSASPSEYAFRKLAELTTTLRRALDLIRPPVPTIAHQSLKPTLLAIHWRDL
jgi:4-alpha-glucanotransferase